MNQSPIQSSDIFTSENESLTSDKHEETTPILPIVEQGQEQSDDITPQLEYTHELSIQQEAVPQEIPAEQPFDASISDIHQDDTNHVCDFNQPDPDASLPLPHDNHLPPEPEEKWSTKESIPVVKRRRPKQYSRDKNEPSDGYNNYGYERGRYRENSRSKWPREQGNRYHRAYDNQQYYERERGGRSSQYRDYQGHRYENERKSYERNDYEKNDYENNDYEKNGYDHKNEYDNRNQYDEYRSTPVSNSQPQTQNNTYVNPVASYYTGSHVQPVWNPNLWLNYLALKENLKYLDMYYYQNYPQLAGQLFYTPALCQPTQSAYPCFNGVAVQSSEAYYSPPTKQPETVKKQISSTLPDPFGQICLPRFQITVNKCTISVNCCKMDRFQADVLLIPYSSSNFTLFPSFKAEEHFSSKQRGQAVIKSQVLKGQASNGKVSLVRTDKSSFKWLAFMKVCSPYEESFTTCFNRGLSNLLTDAAGRTAVVPYSNEFGSSQEKAKRLVELMRGEGGWDRVVVGCQDVASFKRMVEGFSRVVCQLDERGDHRTA